MPESRRVSAAVALEVELMCGLFGVVQDEPLGEHGIDSARAAQDAPWHQGPDRAGTD